MTLLFEEDIEMDQKTLEFLEVMIDKYGLKEVLSGLSYICSKKSEQLLAEHLTANMEEAKKWMKHSYKIDTLSAWFEKEKE